jgi:hypothetical protein
MTGAKLAQLSEKLTGMQPPSLEQPTRSYEQRLKQLEELTDKRTLQDEQSFSEVREEMLKVGTKIAEEKSTIEVSVVLT